MTAPAPRSTPNIATHEGSHWGYVYSCGYRYRSGTDGAIHGGGYGACMHGSRYRSGTDGVTVADTDGCNPGLGLQLRLRIPLLQCGLGAGDHPSFMLGLGSGIWLGIGLGSDDGYGQGIFEALLMTLALTLLS